MCESPFAKAGSAGATLSRSSWSREEEEKVRSSSLLLPALGKQPAFAIPPAALWVEVPPLQHSFPLLAPYARHCPLHPITGACRYPFATPMSLSIFSFLIAASFALRTLTPANSPGSPGDLRGYAHPGTAAMLLDSACLGVVCG